MEPRGPETLLPRQELDVVQRERPEFAAAVRVLSFANTLVDKWTLYTTLSGKPRKESSSDTETAGWLSSMVYPMQRTHNLSSDVIYDTLHRAVLDALRHRGSRAAENGERALSMVCNFAVWPDTQMIAEHIVARWMLNVMASELRTEDGRLEPMTLVDGRLAPGQRRVVPYEPGTPERLQLFEVKRIPDGLVKDALNAMIMAHSHNVLVYHNAAFLRFSMHRTVGMHDVESRFSFLLRTSIDLE